MGFFSKLLSGGDTVKGIIEGTGTLAKDIRIAVTGVSPELEAKAQELEAQMLLAQAEINKLEAQGNPFQRSWRPALAWSIILVIFVQYLLYPILAWIWKDLPAPVLQAAELWPIVLGLIGYRSFEKTKGVSR